MESDGGPAFPRALGERTTETGTEYAISQIGMSLRDYFAGKAMEGSIAYEGLASDIGPPKAEGEGEEEQKGE